MVDRQFTQEELNRIVASRLQRERDRINRVFENTLKRCMAVLSQELYVAKQVNTAEMKDTLLSMVPENQYKKQHILRSMQNKDGDIESQQENNKK